jgi:light-regulated signal transduction histidine kinase (bacteriophytochrome)
MNQALRDALANLRAAVDESGAVITSDNLPVVAWDLAPAVQLFQNLVANAVKYRQPDRTPRVHIGCEQLDDVWCFSVRDNGIGMDQAYIERAFVLFKRLHGREYPGTGIGLAICRKLVERQGGSICAESVLGRGSVFYFTLPFQPQPETSEQD